MEATIRVIGSVVVNLPSGKRGLLNESQMSFLEPSNDQLTEQQQDRVNRDGLTIVSIREHIEERQHIRAYLFVNLMGEYQLEVLKSPDLEIVSGAFSMEITE
jgi:hypothetical protein